MSSFGRGLAALGAVAGGYVKGLDSYERRLGDEEERAMRKTQFENQQDVVNKQKKLDISLANAAAPREVQAGAVLDGGQTQEFYKDPAQVTPQMQDDRRIEAEMRAEVPGAKPVSLATGQVTPGYGTTGKMGLGNMITKDKPDAAALNSPEAQDERIGLAYMEAGQPEKAKKYAADAMALREMGQVVSDKAWKRKVSGAMMGGADGLAELFTKSEFGPMAGKTAKAVVSKDGASVTYHLVNPDGTLAPSKMPPFTNDQNGLIQAAYLLDSSVSPENRHASYVADKKAAAQQTKDAAVFEETKRHNRATEANTATGQQITDSRARDLNATKVEENDLKREIKEDAAKLTKSSQLASFDTMLGTLDRLGKHPGLSRSVGVMGALPTMPGSNSANFQAELNTFQSQAFLPMVAQLKGMGALSDAEGKKLTAAVGALDPKMGEQAFRDSVGRITKEMQAGYVRMGGVIDKPEGDWNENLPRFTNSAEALKLPPGSLFIDANGVTRRRP